jgi:hypothetical protein
MPAAHDCKARLLGVACITHMPGFGQSHNGSTSMADGGKLLLTWTYVPPGKSDGEVAPCVSCGDPPGNYACDRHATPVCDSCACPHCAFARGA